MMAGSSIPNFPRDATPEARMALLDDATRRLMEKHDQGGGATLRDVVEMTSRLLILNGWQGQRIAELEKALATIEDHLTRGGPHVD